MLRINQAVITGGSFTQVNAASRDGFQILQDSVADGAFHNSKERFDPPKCHEKTRIAVLQRILDWVFRQDEDTCDAFIMWLYGPAGAGKSAIMQTIAEKLDASHHLVASFFFSRNHPTRGNADRLVATIAYELALILPPRFRQDVVLVIEHDPLIFSKTLEVQFTELISRPMEQLFMSGFSTNHTYLVTIDGLDECDNTQIQSKIIDLAFKVHHTSQHLPLLFLIASRPELEITSSFDCRNADHMLLRLALDHTYLPYDDIREYIMAEFEEIKKTHRFRSSIPVDWPSQEAVKSIVSKSSGQFIYAATVVKYVASIRRRPTECLDKILGLRPIGKDTPFAELDSLYRHILSKADDLETVLMVIGVVSLKPPFLYFIDGLAIFRSTRHIESLLSLDPGSLNILFQDLSCLVSGIGTPWENELHISHASLSDFLFDRSRSQNLCVVPRNVHTACVNQCLTILNDIATPSLVVEQMLHRLCYHFPLADPESVIVGSILDFTLQKFLSCAHGLLSAFLVQGPSRYVTLVGSYIYWLESMTQWDNREVDQFRMDQLDVFDLYLTSHLDVYFSNPDLLWALVISTGSQETSVHPPTKISEKIDVGGLILYQCLSLEDFDKIGTTKYLGTISEFLHDPGRAGKYLMTGASYAAIAFHVLRHLCSRWSCPLPRSLPKLSMHKRRNFPVTWHRKQARRVFDWRRYSSMYRVEKYGEVLEPSEFFAQRRFPDMVNWKVYVFEEQRDIRAYAVFRSALSSLPYLLEKSEMSEELIDLARTARFGAMAKRHGNLKGVRLAKKAIKKYLARMEGQS